MLNYYDLVEQCKAKGWKTWCFSIEIGCRGHLGNSAWKALKMLKIVGKDRQSLLNDAGNNAQTASTWILQRRSEFFPRRNSARDNVNSKPQCGCENGGEDHPRSLVTTMNQTCHRNGGENHPHSLAPKPNHDRMNHESKAWKGSLEGSVLPLGRI